MTLTLRTIHHNNRHELRLRLGRLDITYSTCHWRPQDYGVRHGPQAWPWWHLLSLDLLKMNPDNPMPPNRRLWIYTRWGAVHIDAFWRAKEIS